VTSTEATTVAYSSPARGALAGLRILEIGALITGPITGRLLAAQLPRGLSSVGQDMDAALSDSCLALACLEAAGVSAAPINSAAEVDRDSQFAAREMLVQHVDEGLGTPVLGPGITPRLSIPRPALPRNNGTL
jgi:crotonobetainyl-CoA:carnitine CoA-transferase CaiB-like acyl-CoA transferase